MGLSINRGTPKIINFNRLFPFYRFFLKIRVPQSITSHNTTNSLDPHWSVNHDFYHSGSIISQLYLIVMTIVQGGGPQVLLVYNPYLTTIN